MRIKNKINISEQDSSPPNYKDLKRNKIILGDDIWLEDEVWS